MSESPLTLPLPDEAGGWDHYFLYFALVASIKSKDPKCRVGAAVASRDNVLLSTGFNGFARGVDDDDTLLADVPEKLKMVCHAETNAIMNAARIGVALEQATIYVTKFPCLSCCNAIIQAGIKRIYTHDHRYWTDDPLDKEHFRKPIVLRQAGIQVDAPYHPDFSIMARLKQPAVALEAVPDRKAPGTETRLETEPNASEARSGLAG